MRLTVFSAGLLVAASLFVTGGQQAKAQSVEGPTNVNQSLVVKVQPGDSLSKIAKQHETTYVRLYDANPEVQHPDVIYPGQEIRVPDEAEVLEHRALPRTVAVKPAKVKATTPQKSVSKQSRVRSSNAKPAPSTSIAPASGNVWDQLAKCESGGNWAINTGNGYYGGLQFTLSSWKAAGGSGMPHQASREEQITRGEILKSKQGWGAWPACTKKLGLR